MKKRIDEKYIGVIGISKEFNTICFEFEKGDVEFLTYDQYGKKGDKKEIVGTRYIGKRIKVEFINPSEKLTITDKKYEKTRIEDIPGKKLIGKIDEYGRFAFYGGDLELFEEYINQYIGWYVIIELLD